MRSILPIAILLILSWPSRAADIEAGKASAEPCAACHGINGISVSDDIPNLAGQKALYLESQLKAFRSGKRENDIMNAIAAQLGDAEIANLAAFFSSRPGGSGDEVSELVAGIETTRVGFPEGYESSFTRYTTISFENRKQVRHYFANAPALEAAKAGRPLPDGSVLLVEIHAVRTDDGGNPVKGDDGHLVADKLVAYTAMETRAGWGADIPDILRNGDWNYAVFAADRSLRTGTNQAKCLACHKPLDGDSYVFTLKALAAAGGN